MWAWVVEWGYKWRIYKLQFEHLLRIFLCCDSPLASSDEPLFTFISTPSHSSPSPTSNPSFIFLSFISSNPQSHNIMNLLYHSDSSLQLLPFPSLTIPLTNIWTCLALLAGTAAAPKSQTPPPSDNPNVVGEAPQRSFTAEVEGVTKKGKFTAYYYNICEEQRECEIDESPLLSMCSSELTEWWENWDKLLKMRMESPRWYAHLDLTELNGNVVRLWDSPSNSIPFPTSASSILR